MKHEPRRDPEFLRYYARVLLREAKARRGTPFAATLLQWASRARREAAAFKPVQGDLFGMTPAIKEAV